MKAFMCSLQSNMSEESLTDLFISACSPVCLSVAFFLEDEQPP